MKLNNKGYTLVEIILAFAITFALVYFFMDLIIKMKNNNDDVLVETLVKTDQSIITNKLMKYAIEEEKNFSCDSLKINNKTVKYKDEVILTVNDYSEIDIDKITCNSNNLGSVSINIPLKVKQIDKNFDVKIDYKYDIGDMIKPTCSLSASGTTINATPKDEDGGSGLKYYGWDSAYSGSNSTSINITRTGTYTYYVMDVAGNVGSCSGTVTATETKEKCGSGCFIHAGYCYHNPCSPSYCGITRCSQSRPTITYLCDSGTKLNNSYCWKIN